MAEIQRGELRLSYRRIGEGPPLVLISPLGWSGGHWHLHQVPAFAREFDVITFDHRGTGGSSPSAGPYSTRLLARDVVVLLEEIGLVEPVFMVGLDGGGAVVQWLCLDEPAAVRAAAFVATSSGRIDTRPVPRSLPPEQLVELVARGWPEYLRARLAGREYFVAAGDEVAGPLVESVAGEGVTDLLPFLWHVQAGFEHQLTERLHEIELPCFVLVGERDDEAPEGTANRIESSLELAKRLFYSEYVEIEDAARAAHVERPDAFNEAIVDFLVRH